MVLPVPVPVPVPCPLTGETIAGLKAAVLLLLTLLIKAQVQIKAASAVRFLLLALQTLMFLAAAGTLVLVSAGGVAYGISRRANPA